ncbi:MAG: type II toxin-antitoxin system Phd/YefM family antitoxin [Gemmatimonadales bacterium]
MAETYNLYEAKTHLSDLVERAAAGVEIVNANAGTPLPRLGRWAGAERGATRGGWAGHVWIADDFDGALPAEELSGFTEGGGADPEAPTS